ncbi:LysR substrate-binding domain-containing protein [Rhizobium calliandrae]|uniref:LysR substrate-binding domain-containing protein n=1 Tax=Rhizobium calliandrae TaxID=1312182 RepID=A0ABT7KP36_9HYPH|nr:LysR substrate-binding domain-containing protein [Rhizobium calliandrae]MDL2410376.1 LysR substrate-binding domain-containing protein [Rhizobium calliandrae]
MRVGILASLTTGFLHCVLRRLRETQPSLQILLREGTSLEMLHALATGELDISFVTGQYDIRGYRSRILWNETIYLVIPTGHPLARQEVVTWEELREKVSS